MNSISAAILSELLIPTEIVALPQEVLSKGKNKVHRAWGVKQEEDNYWKTTRYFTFKEASL